MDRIVSFRRILICVAFATALAVFALEVLLPAKIAVPMLYVPIMVGMARLVSARWTWAFFAFCAALSVIGHYASRHEAESVDGLMIAINQATSFVIGAVATWLALVGRRTEAAWRDTLETLQRNEQQLQRFVEYMPAAVAMFDQSMRYVAHSRRWVTELRLHTDNLVGRSHYDVFPNLPERWKDAHQQGLAGQTVRCENDSLVHADGRTDLERWEVRPWYTSKNAVGGILIIVETITERSKIQQDLRDSEALYRSLVENIPLYISRKDRLGRLTFANRRYCEMLGKPLEQLTGSTLDKYYPPAQAAKYAKEDRQVVETGATLETVESHLTPSGEEMLVQVIKTPVRDAEGRIVGTQVIFWDVTAQRRAEDELRRSEQEFRSLAENMPDIVTRYDRQLRHIYLNPQVSAVTGKPADFFLGKSNSELNMPPGLVQLWREKMLAAFESGQPQSMEFAYTDHSGSVRHFESRLVPEPGRNGEIASILCISRDVTERLHAQEQAQAHLAQLAHVSRLTTMGELVSEIAHEINQPLHAIANFAQASINILDASSERGPANLRDWLEQISEQAIRAGEIIRRAGRFVRKTPVRRSTLDINDLVRDCLRLLAFDLRVKHIRLRCELGNSLPTVLADAVQVQQVLVNLVRNAVDALATNEENDRFLIVRTTSGPDGSVQVSVRDNGRGLVPENASRLFEPFFTTKPDGMGMGLAVSQSIVQAHAGQLWAEPNTERGVTFHFTLPARKEEPHDVFCHV